MGCEADPCKDLECGPGDCVDGICNCPDGFSGFNCEVNDLCFGLRCLNGNCDPDTESCNCNLNYFGESCDFLCVNGKFINGVCNCSLGYEGSSCEMESRDRFLGWWGCEQWTWTSQIGDTTFQGPSLGSIKFECGNSIPEIELIPAERSSGLMSLTSENRIIGQVAEKMINFELQNFAAEVQVYGSASIGTDGTLNIELYFFNSTTSDTERARGIFTIYRHLKDCS